ncbi:MAG: dihydrofolate reductase [Bacteroidales bacterium]
MIFENLALVVAVAQNGVIGKNNDLLWHISDDLKRFKSLTIGHTIIMGRHTYESFPNGALPKRQHWVLSSSMFSDIPSVEVVPSVEEILKKLSQKKEDTAFVIGGGQIYRQLLPYCQKVYLTKVYVHLEGDTFFEDLDPQCWTLSKEGDLNVDKLSNLQYRYLEYTRKEA